MPVDNASSTAPFQYGSWVFWRYLEERLAQTGNRIDPGVIRSLWELADGSPGGPGMYSIQAVHELLARHTLLGVQLKECADEVPAHASPPFISAPWSQQNVGVTHVRGGRSLDDEV